MKFKEILTEIGIPNQLTTEKILVLFLKLNKLHEKLQMRILYPKKT
jgi:hypothetical protein